MVSRGPQINWDDHQSSPIEHAVQRRIALDDNRFHASHPAHCGHTRNPYSPKSATDPTSAGALVMAAFTAAILCPNRFPAEPIRRLHLVPHTDFGDAADPLLNGRRADSIARLQSRRTYGVGSTAPVTRSTTDFAGMQPANCSPGSATPYAW